jgi:hypothetical protein
LPEPKRARVFSGAPPNGRHVAILLAWTLVVAYSFAPFDFTLSPGAIEEALEEVAHAGRTDVADLFRHLLAFAAVGAVHRTAFRSRAAGRRLSVAGLIIGLLFCVAIEVWGFF